MTGSRSPAQLPNGAAEPPPARAPGAPRALKGEIAVFLLSGGAAALVNLATGALVRAVAGLRAHAVGVVAGFVVGTGVSFLLNRELTFRARRDHVGLQATKFVLLAVGGIALAAGVAELALRVAMALFGASISARLLANAAHLVAIGTTTIYNFVGMKYFALRH